MKKFNFKNVKADTWARTLLLLLAIAISIYKFNENGGDLFSITISVLTSFTFICNWWKNNSFTGIAQKADEFIEEIEIIESGDIDVNNK